MLSGLRIKFSDIASSDSEATYTYQRRLPSLIHETGNPCTYIQIAGKILMCFQLQNIDKKLGGVKKERLKLCNISSGDFTIIELQSFTPSEAV